MTPHPLAHSCHTGDEHVEKAMLQLTQGRGCLRRVEIERELAAVQSEIAVLSPGSHSLPDGVSW